jgi:large subunit ribosomal protein L24
MNSSFHPKKLRLHVGDTVMVRSGAQKGKTGKVMAVLPSEGKVIVEGIRMVKRHIKPNRTHPKGTTLEKTLPVWASKVGVIHPTNPKRTSRIGLEIAKDGTKKRVYRATGKEIT